MLVYNFRWQKGKKLRNTWHNRKSECRLIFSGVRVIIATLVSDV